jgi:hypothetical protein
MAALSGRADHDFWSERSPKQSGCRSGAIDSSRESAQIAQLIRLRYVMNAPAISRAA